MAEGEAFVFQLCRSEQKNKHTLSKTRRDVGLLFEFLKPKQENRKIEEIQPQDTNQ